MGTRERGSGKGERRRRCRRGMAPPRFAASCALSRCRISPHLARSRAATPCRLLRALWSPELAPARRRQCRPALRPALRPVSLPAPLGVSRPPPSAPPPHLFVAASPLRSPLPVPSPAAPPPPTCAPAVPRVESSCRAPRFRRAFGAPRRTARLAGSADEIGAAGRSRWPRAGRARKGAPRKPRGCGRAHAGTRGRRAVVSGAGNLARAGAARSDRSPGGPTRRARPKRRRWEKGSPGGA